MKLLQLMLIKLDNCLLSKVTSLNRNKREQRRISKLDRIKDNISDNRFKMQIKNGKKNCKRGNIEFSLRIDLPKWWLIQIVI